MSQNATVESRGSRVEGQTPGGAAAFAEARELQWVWKTAAMEVMAVAVCRLALVRGVSGEFSANDLKLEEHGGSGIAGAVFFRLAKDEVLTPVMIQSGTEWQQKTARNAGGNRVGVWRLKNHALASTLLQRLEARVSARNAQTLTQAELLPAS